MSELTEQELAAIAREGSAKAHYRLERGPNAPAWETLIPEDQEPYYAVADQIQASRP